MILYNLESHSNLPMALFYGARTKADLVFHEYLLFLSNRFKNFKYFPNISTQDPSWSDSPRFIDLSYIQQKIAYNENSHFYFCGPSQMTDSLIQALQNAQFNTSHIHNEKFISPTAIDLSKLSEMNCDIEVNGKTYLYQGKQSLLEFMEQNSIPVAYACRSGVCGACKCKVKGRSLQLSDSGLTEQEKIWGFALTCVSYPLENLKIDTSEN